MVQMPPTTCFNGTCCYRAMIHMTGILYIDSCVLRETSRTERLAQALLDSLGRDDVETVVLEEAGIEGMDSAGLERRNRFIEADDFSDPMFDHAKKLLDADIIVISAPFWESCFPNTLKSYLEAVSIPRLTYRYNEMGMPVGNCHATVYYITTRGGPATDEEDLGLAIIRRTFWAFGTTDVRVLSASNLDIVGNDVEVILAEAMGRIPGIL